jgi:hypothetical protein
VDARRPWRDIALHDRVWSAPMAVLAFVAFWIIVALALLFLAFRGGPKAARERREALTRRGVRGWVFGLVLAILVLGIVIPLAVFRDDKDRDSFPAANVSNLTPTQLRGQEVFGESCRMCHALDAANAAGVVGPDLDELKPPKELVLDAVENGRARGNGNMAANLVEGEDAEAVAEFIAVSVGSEEQ